MFSPCIARCFVVLVLSLSTAGFAQITWHTDANLARQDQIASGKPALLYFYSGQARGEAAFDPVWAEPLMVSASRGFVMVALHVKHPASATVAQAMQVARVPSVVVVDAQGNTRLHLDPTTLTPDTLRQTLMTQGRTTVAQPAQASPVSYSVATGSTEIASAPPTAPEPANVAEAVQAGLLPPGTTFPYIARIHDVGRFGDGKATYDGKTLYIIGTGQADIGTWVVFEPPADRGRFADAHVDHARTALLRNHAVLLADGTAAVPAAH